jgi:hypothetical protein
MFLWFHSHETIPTKSVSTLAVSASASADPATRWGSKVSVRAVPSTVAMVQSMLSNEKEFCIANRSGGVM